MVIPVLGSLSLMWVTQLGFWVLALAWPQPWVWRSLSGVQKVYAQGRVDGQIGQDRQTEGGTLRGTGGNRTGALPDPSPEAEALPHRTQVRPLGREGQEQ